MVLQMLVDLVDLEAAQHIGTLQEPFLVVLELLVKAIMVDQRLVLEVLDLVVAVAEQVQQVEDHLVVMEGLEETDQHLLFLAPL
jgi:hypothetical protein